MAQSINLPGLIHLAAVTTPADIHTSAYQPSAAAGWPTSYSGTVPSSGGVASGDLELHVFIENDGTNNARYTLSGTAPTTGHGFLVPGAITTGTSTELVIRGTTSCVNFKIIATGGSLVATWYLACQDDRR
jgi:hypothetical protein